jgi:hypothetical protein
MLRKYLASSAFCAGSNWSSGVRRICTISAGNRRRHGEIKPLAAAGVGDLDQQLVLARFQVDRQTLLIRRDASLDLVAEHQFAVDPDLGWHRRCPATPAAKAAGRP